VGFLPSIIKNPFPVIVTGRDCVCKQTAEGETASIDTDLSQGILPLTRATGRTIININATVHYKFC
jgi:hypothetical protein